MNLSRLEGKKKRDTWLSGETCCRPTRMRLLLLTTLLFPSLTTGRASMEEEQMVRRLNAPSIVDPRKERLELHCDYDLGGRELYSVIWYKNNEQLLKYTPSLEPKIMVFANAGVNVSLEHSNAERILLLGSQDFRKNMAAYEGRYLCEVSTEEPFYGGFAEANVTVGILPERNPVLDGVAHNYQVGEQLDATCTSAPSLPPAELTFYLNGRKVDSRYTQRERSEQSSAEAVVASLASISLRLEREDFYGGKLTLLCRATLPGIQLRQDYKTEKTATLAASNQRLAQEPPKLSSTSSSARLAEATTALPLTILAFLFHIRI